MGTTLIGEPGKPARAGTTLAEPVRGGSGTRLVSPPGVAATAVATGAGNDMGPVTGWLVVVDGPGRGRSKELGYGMNIIGRGTGNRVALDFGDDQISSDDHFRIAYDGAHRRFHLVPGRGTNLVYLDGAPLLGPMDLTGVSDIQVGATKLHFVPLCRADWDWPTGEQA